jgi:hypothetical protein
MFESLLTHTAIIETKTFTEDAAGQPIENWATAVSGIKCRLDAADRPGLVEDPTYVYNRATHILYMREQSIVLDTRTHRIDVDGIKYEILLISKLYDSNVVHHLELLLELTT